MRSRRRPVRHPLLHLTVGLAVLVEAGACLAATGITANVIMLVISFTTMILIPVGWRLHNPPDRRPWHVAIIGLALLNCSNALSIVRVGTGGTQAWLVELLTLAAGFLIMMNASVMIAVRHARSNDAGMIHAAMIGVGFAGPLWEFVLRPRLQELGTATTAQGLFLIDGLILLTAVGPLLRAARITPRARGSLVYLALSLMSGLSGVIVSIMVDPARAERWSAPFWATGYTFLLAAALHPSSANLTRPASSVLRVATVRLVYLGAILAINPIVGAVPQLWGAAPDALLLSLGTLLMIALVLARIGQLMREREADQEALRHQATHDELTGLSNRRDVLGHLDTALAAWASGQLSHVAVLYCDLDGFKPVNDDLGHRAGDEVLRTVAQRLLHSVRRQDSIGRLGGDEFLIVCPGLGQPELTALQRRVTESVGAPIRIDEQTEIRVGVTIGTALAAAGDCAGSDGLIAAADRRMYAGKRERRSYAVGAR